MPARFFVAERLLMTLWVGALWAIGYLAVPVLFHSLERQVAGEIAGTMFSIVSGIGLFCGVILLWGVLGHLGRAALGQWRFWLLAGMWVIVLVGAVVLQPMMQDLKEQGLSPGSAVTADFGRLHGISSGLYMVTSLGGLILVVFGVYPPSSASVTLRSFDDDRREGT